MKRYNHYEAAFEAYLREIRAPYIGVDEAKRSLSGDTSLKSFDFLVSPPRSPLNWLVDIKGRRFPSGGKHYWKNWAASDDLASLAQWERLFGAEFVGLFVFAFDIVGDFAPLSAEHLYHFRDRSYAFVAVKLDDYVSFSREISPKWSTVAMPTKLFRQFARPARAIFEV